MALTILQTFISLCSQKNTCELKVVSQILTAQDNNVYIYLKRNVNHITFENSDGSLCPIYGRSKLCTCSPQ